MYAGLILLLTIIVGGFVIYLVGKYEDKQRQLQYDLDLKANKPEIQQSSLVTMVSGPKGIVLWKSKYEEEPFDAMQCGDFLQDFGFELNVQQ